MSFNKPADRINCGSKFVNINLLCAFIYAEVEKSAQFACFARVLADEAFAFLTWYESHVKFVTTHHQPNCLQSEKEAIWGWSCRNGIGSIAHNCKGTPCEYLSMRFCATVCGLGNIWVDVPLNGKYAITIREELRKDYIS